jgi:pimeloyl-ACP methyl ester carboxylesterase
MQKLLPFVFGRTINALAIVAPKLCGKIGFRLFCYPIPSKMKGFHHKFLETANQSTFNVNGNEIKLYRWGNGPKNILFLHGWQSHSFRWKSYIDAFPSKEYSLYAIDAPGHGLSSGSFLTVPLYSEVIEKLIADLGQVDAIISHSLGSFSTLYTLYRVPSIPVKRVVSLASPGEADEFVAFYKTALRLSNRSMNHIKRHFESVIQKPVSFFAAASFAAHVTCPGLIIHDENDDETSSLHSVNIHKAWKNSRLKITTGLTHNLKSPEIVQEVLKFVLEEDDSEASAKDVTANERNTLSL